MLKLYKSIMFAKSNKEKNYIYFNELYVYMYN